MGISYRNIGDLRYAAAFEETVERINARGRNQSDGVDASIARATFRVRLETGRTVISLSGTCSAPLMRGSFLTLMRNGSTVMARCVTVWRTLSAAMKFRLPFWF